MRRLTRDGLLIEDPEQPWLDLEPTDTLDHLNAASIRYRIAVGQGAGGRTLTLKNPALVRTDSTPKPFTANRDGFSLNCAVACQAHQRDRLERLCRYITRPALCLERLSTNAAGQVVYQLKNPFRDGTTHILFSPAGLYRPLAALVPRPRINLTRYHGVFAPSSPMRRAIVPTPASARRRRKLKDSAAAPATRQCSPTEFTQRLQRSAHRAADLGAAIEARIRNRHHPLPALRRAAAGHCGRHRSRPHPQDPRPRQQPSTPSPAASARRVTPDPTRSVRRTLKSTRQPARLRVPFLGFPFHPYTRTTTATTAVRSPSLPDRCRSTGPTLPATSTPAILLATREKTRYFPYSQGAGGRTLTLKDPALAWTDSTPKPFTVHQNGFSLKSIGRITWVLPDCSWYGRRGQGRSTSEKLKRRIESGLTSYGCRGCCLTDHRVQREGNS